MNIVKIKICGITQFQQAKEIASLGIDAVGFVLYPPSPRFVASEIVRDILPGLPPFVKTVGVFVNETVERIVETVRTCGLDLAQLSGDESPNSCFQLDKAGIRWIKAIRLKTKIDERMLSSYPGSCFLFDAWSDDQYGGTGRAFDWRLLSSVRDRYSIILAGGINAGNVADAIQKVHPYAVDVSSGVESAPGVKSISEIKNLITAVRSVSLP